MDKVKARNRELVLLLLVALILFAGFFSTTIAMKGKPTYDHLYYPASASLIFLVVHIFLRRLTPRADPIIFPTAAALTSLGLVMIYRLDTDLAFLQLIWLCVGSAAMLIVVLFLRKYELLSSYKYSLGLAAVALLASTMLFGVEVNGAKLWLKIGPLSFQPSEISKILLVIFLAAFFAEKRELLSIPTHRLMGIPVPELKYFIPLLIMWGISVLLMIFQKDLGSSLLFFGIFICMVYVSTTRKSYVFAGLALFLLGAYLCYLGFSHVQARVITWLNPLNPATIERESYQIAQSLFAFSSGKIAGTGLGLGYPSLIPAVSTDFIFSAVGEELGLVGSVFVVILYLVMVSRGIKVALAARDDFGRCLAAGLTSTIALQSFIIMGGVTRLIPLTGITLPFMSYGGSSLVANYILTGLLMIVSHRSLSVNPLSIREGVGRWIVR